MILTTKWKWSVTIWIISAVLFFSNLYAEERWDRLGARIYASECSSRFENLISWNEGEEFLSLGIGHFIWYPETDLKSFEETFPLLKAFLSQRGCSLPAWIGQNKSCPVKSRSEWLAISKSPVIDQVRHWLLETRALQAEWIAMRGQAELAQILATLPLELEPLVAELMQSEVGLFALIDYLHFKGTGLNPSERYAGQGWGLKQVFEEMLLLPPTEKPLVRFILAAKAMLCRRVRNAPKERIESRWLAGWLKRVEGYDTNEYMKKN